MTESARTTITLVVLLALLLAAAAWGWSAATEPLPAKVDRPICVDTEIAAGERLYPQQVTVSVYNASSREGLASRTVRGLTDQGFAKGKTGNTTRERGGYAQIWTTEPESPAVQLVASHLGDVDIERRDGLGPGVTVVVGDSFDQVAEGEPFVEVSEAAIVCSPPIV